MVNVCFVSISQLKVPISLQVLSGTYLTVSGYVMLVTTGWEISAPHAAMAHIPIYHFHGCTILVVSYVNLENISPMISCSKHKQCLALVHALNVNKGQSIQYLAVALAKRVE